MKCFDIDGSGKHCLFLFQPDDPRGGHGGWMCHIEYRLGLDRDTDCYCLSKRFAALQHQINCQDEVKRPGILQAVKDERKEATRQELFRKLKKNQKEHDMLHDELKDI
jgi:hypothetical protein